VKYLFLLDAETDNWMPTPGTPESKALFEEWAVAEEAMQSAGVYIDCAPLYPHDATTTVRVRDGETIITDGPAAEIKEHLGGYVLIECADLDEALKWAGAIPTAKTGSVIIRPVVTVPEGG
jgi:hypothetical protein